MTRTGTRIPSIGKDYELSPFYTVYESNGIYYAMDAEGEIYTHSAVAHTVINTALNGLPARTTIEEVELKGDFSLTGQILMPDYARLKGPAHLTMGNGIDLNGYMIENDDQVNGNPSIEVVDLTLDRGANVVDDNGGIKFTGSADAKRCTDVLVENVRLLNMGSSSAREGIFIQYSSRVKVFDNYLLSKSDDTERCWIEIKYSDDVEAKGNHVIDGQIVINGNYVGGDPNPRRLAIHHNYVYGPNTRGRITGLCVANHLEIDHNFIRPYSLLAAINLNSIHRASITDNIIYYATPEDGDDTISTAGIKGCLIDGNIIVNGCDCGINCETATYWLTITNNFIDSPASNGIRVLSAGDDVKIIISKNIIRNCSMVIAGHGINVDGCWYTDVGDNIIFDDQGTHTQKVGIDFINDCSFSKAHDNTVSGSLGANALIRVDNPSDHVQLLNNVLHDATNGIIIDTLATNTRVSGNQFKTVTNELTDSGTTTQYDLKLPLSYEIYKSGTNYYAMDADGYILSHGAVASTVIQAALDVALDGLKIEILAYDIWDITSPLIIKRHGTEIDMTKAYAGGLRQTGTGAVIEADGDQTAQGWIEGLTLRNLKLLGSANADYGLRLRGVRDSVIMHPKIRDFTKNGAKAISTERAAISAQDTIINEFFGPRIFNCYHGICFGDGSYQMNVWGGQFSGTAKGTGSGFMVGGSTGADFVLSGQTIDNFQYAYNIQLDHVTIINPLPENVTTGFYVPNFLYRLAVINPSESVGVTAMWSLGGNPRISIINPEGYELRTGTSDVNMSNRWILDPMNYVDATLSGTPKIATVKIGGNEYFFKVYPTKT